MSTLWLHCRQPFDRSDIPINSDIRDRIQEYIEDWTGWTGAPHNVRWSLRIHEQPVVPDDAIVYFVWNYSTNGVVSPAVNRVLSDPSLSTDDRTELLQARDQWRNESLSTSPKALGATFFEGSEAISEAWVRPTLYQEFGIRLSSPSWTSGPGGTLDRVCQDFAITVLHEVGHNKVEPAMQASTPGWDMHVDGSCGAFGGDPCCSSATVPNPANLLLLDTHFDRPQLQKVVPHSAFGGP